MQLARRIIKTFIDSFLISSGISEMKMRFDESDNVFIRGSRFITDKISGIAGTVFW